MPAPAWDDFLEFNVALGISRGVSVEVGLSPLLEVPGFERELWRRPLHERVAAVTGESWRRRVQLVLAHAHSASRLAMAPTSSMSVLPGIVYDWTVSHVGSNAETVQLEECL